MKNQPELQRKALKEEAKGLVRGGYSVIPVQGDHEPSNPKKPAIAWKRFQSERADVGEIDGWFRGDITALGIVCGRVSRLMVIDFDDYSGYRRFRRRFPEYKNSRTVKTRRGFHVYFRTGLKVNSQQFSGGDVKGEGGFVIAPPSTIGGMRYEWIGGVMGPELDRREVDEILNFLVIGNERLAAAIGRPAVSDLLAMYRRMAEDIGRNNALYRAASIGRESGLSEEEVVELLARAHAMQTGQGQLRMESVEKRWMEGLRTIRSAYSSGSTKVVSGGLPNSVRERLLSENGSSVVARLLDVFGKMGWMAGAWKTLSEIVHASAEYGLGRRSVVETLTGSLGVYRGRPLIKSRYVEYVDKRELNVKRRGRPVEKVYRIPDVGELVRLLGVAWSPSDELAADDLRSAHAYRLALHREYIGRESPEAPQAWLGKRIGVSDRTIRRFNRQLGVRSTVKVGVFELDRGRLKLLPKRRGDGKRWATPGYWLETGDGRRWPAWRHLGRRLLDECGDGVKVCMRRMSQWRLGGSDGVRREIAGAGDVQAPGVVAADA